MSPKIAATIGLAGALIFAAAFLWFEPSDTPASSLVAAVVPRLPQLVPLIVGGFAALVLLITAAALIVDIRRVRFRLKNVAPLNGNLWNIAFTGTGLSRLALRLRHISAENSSSADHILIDRPFEARDACREIARLYRDWLSRGHFFTALIILVGLGAAGLAEEHGLMAPGYMPIATMPIFATALGLVFLAVYLRLAVDAAAEPLVDAIACLPFKRVEISLLQSIAATLQRRHSAANFDASSPLALEGLARSLSRGHSSLQKIAAQLANNAEVVASATRALADLPQQSQVAGIDSEALSELRSAIERLTTIIEGLPSIVQGALASEREPATSEPSLFSSQTTQGDDLRGELRRLLHELE